METVRILVVEDERIVAHDIQKSLESMGYAVAAVVSTGRGAIEKAAEIHPDLVLMDILLKGKMDGIEAAEQIRQHFDLPVVYITAHSDEDTLQRAKITEPFGYVLKPFEKRELKVAVELSLFKHKIEKALRQSEERYRSLVENTLDGYFIYEFPTGRLFFLNQKMCELYGCTQQEGLKLSFWGVIGTDEQERFQDWIQAQSQGNAAVYFPQIFTSRRKDGSTFMAEVSASLVTFEGKVVVQGIVRDVSERERLQRQLQHAQRMQAVGTLAGGIAHEIRNPLAICSSAAQFLFAEDITPEFRKECLEKILAGSRRASAIIENLLNFARSPERVEIASIDLISVLKETLSLVAPEARLQHIELRSNFPKEPLLVFGVPGLLPQAFMNLFLNAINAMPDGGILTLSVDKTDGKASVVISDTGRGIPEKDLSEIFDPFYTTSPVGQGTGLGLSISYAIVRKHLGSMGVASIPGRGTTFTVRLPLAI